jgi:hypothetical protein
VNSGIILLRVISLGVLAACMAAPSLAVDGQTTIAFAENRIGMPPADFDLGVTGHGQPGKWTIVRDESAAGGVAIELSSDDPTEDRFDFAVYQSLSLKNLAASTRFNLINGTMKSAGLVFRFRDASNYYVLRANALESRVDVYRVQSGEMKRISGTDADVVLNHRQTLKLVANGDQFEVSLDNTALFTVWDQTFLTDGRIGLWTQEDNLTRFDQFQITALPWSEEP